MKIILSVLVILSFMISNALSNDQSISSNNRIDGLRPDAPVLAKAGDYNIGVRTLNLHHKNQIDVLNIKSVPLNINSNVSFPLYDRPLTIEVWYPADTAEQGSEYPDTYLRDGKTKVTYYGSAVRDAAPLNQSQAFPLIIISHGYPGNRILLSHFGENLASKGYIVASIDHTDSMYQDASAFASTLYNRPHDQKFILKTMSEFNSKDGHFLENMINADNAGLIGYSMGGYGAVVTAGGGITKAVAENEEFSPNSLLKSLEHGTKPYEDFMMTDNFKAIIAIAPWGMERGMWDDQGLENVRIPTFFMAGSADTTSGYENGIKAIYEKSIGIERYLLTFENAGHNAAAPIPAPIESVNITYPDSDRPVFGHYADPVWDTLRMNNIAQHYATAYFGKMLKNQLDMGDFLNLPETSPGLSFEHLPKTK